MIITCDKCATKFNLDETRIKPTGSKVRCSVCRHVFTTFPPESPERDEIEKTEEKPGDMEEPAAFEEKETGKAPEDKSFLGLEGIDDLGRELGIEDDEEDEPAQTAADPTRQAETAQADDKKTTPPPFPAYELELDQELEEKISALEEEDQDVDTAAPESDIPDEFTKADFEPGTGPSEPVEEAEETDLEFEKDTLEEDMEEKPPGLDLGGEEEFSIEDDSMDLDLAEGPDFDEPPEMDTLEAVPEESGPTVEKPVPKEHEELFSMDTEDFAEPETGFDSGVAEVSKEAETEFDFEDGAFDEEISNADLGGEEEFSLDEKEEAEEFSLDTEEDDSLDLDIEEFDTREDEKEPEFDLDLDDETLELGIEDLEADEEAEFGTGEEEQAEFDFMAEDEESFELEIDSNLGGETEEKGFEIEETDSGKQSAELTATGEEQPELEPPELEIGELDLTEPDEMDLELDEETGLESSDEFEFELEDEEEELEAGIEFEDEGESDEAAQEEAEEFDLTLYDESLDDEFEEEFEEEAAAEEKAGVKPETETDADGGIEEPKIEKPPVPDFMERDTAEKPAGSSKFFKFILALLVLAIMLVAGYSTCIIMGIEVPYLSSVKIPFIESVLQKHQSRTEPVNIVLDNQSINGRFASNKAEGKLFIITGRAANKSAFPVSHLKVEGTLITKGDETARTKQVFCGNTVPEETLKTAGIGSIDKLLSQKSGMDGSNENIRPNGSIPFMIVFSNLPDNLENFSVKLAGHSRPGRDN